MCVRRAERVIASERRALIAPHEVKVEDSPERLVTGVDGAMVARVDPAHRRRASKKGGRVKGKGALANFWKEVKTCVTYAIGQKMYFATQADHEAFGDRVLTMVRRAGGEAA